MTETAYYSDLELDYLQNRGVHLPDKKQVSISKNVDLDNIHPGSTLHPMTHLKGATTRIYGHAQIALRGPVVVEDSIVGPESIVGNVGGVTLLKSVLGPRTILGAGESEQAVFLGKESPVNGFTTGLGFRTRKGTLYEEDASSAQHTDTKMTLLFPWATLGSNINFCDALLSGGTGGSVGQFTEVGSGSVHFNFTLRGDKATGSLFGNVVEGVFLDQERIFIGGNNSLIGPLQSDFGVFSAAGARLSGRLAKALHFGEPWLRATTHFNPTVMRRVKPIFETQAAYIGQLVALRHWYQEVRGPLAAHNKFMQEVYHAAEGQINLNILERLDQLQVVVKALEPSIQALEHMNDTANLILEQRRILQHWPAIDQHIRGLLQNFRPNLPQTLTNEFDQHRQTHHLAYTQWVQSLSLEAVRMGKAWLKSIAFDVEQIILEMW